MKKAFNKVLDFINVESVLKKEPMGIGRSLLAILFLSLCGFLVQSIIQNGFFSFMHFVYILYPVVVLFNILPIFLIMVFFYFITGKTWIGAIVAYPPVILLNIANYFKTFYRDEPLKLSDLQLITETSDMTRNYQLKISFGIIVGVLVAFAAIFFAIKYFRSKKVKWSVKVTGIIATICCMFLSYNIIYTNKPLYEKLPTFAIHFHDTSVARHHGLLYSLLLSADSAIYDMPKGYSDEVAEDILSQHADASVANENEKINIIAIMGEAFFDVTRGGDVTFEDGVNPYENYEKLKKEGYSGKLIVPGFGGSTESSEFEFLTGISQYLLDSSMPTAYKTYVTQPAYSLVRYFKDEGYDAIAMHPGHSWFYNRHNAYKFLGFDDYISVEDMGDNLPNVYGYVMDRVATEQILKSYLEHYEKDPQKPYFNFTVTIQNHGPYPDHDEGREKIYNRPENISDENYYIINNYLTGVKATDKLLGDICDFAESRQEPVAVLFFGDHLPYLDQDGECFNAFGYDISANTEEGIENKYKVEYLMWSNDSAKEIIKKSRGRVKKGEGPEISANFLGTELLDYLGMTKNAYFDFVSSVKDKVNVISQNYYKSGDEKTPVPDEETQKLLEKYRFLQYYNLRRYNIDK